MAVAFDLARARASSSTTAFFVENWDRALGPFSLPLPLLTIALPVGVSFFTFQAISYVVDVKRRLVEPASTIDVAIYLSLLPAPGRGADRARARVPAAAAGAARSDEGRGGQRDRADRAGAGEEAGDRGHAGARRSSTRCSRCPDAYAAPDLWLAAYAYTAQIYCDFSGYTDMAIGLALLMGYVFPQNFRSPYRATGFSDFWRRWHMTLSRFLRDFLYIPLGGNRKGKWKTYRNLMLTMVLGGLWHGAAWPFVLWGFFHGDVPVHRARVARAGEAPRLAALVRDLPPRRVRLDPVPLDVAGRRRRLLLGPAASPARLRCSRFRWR